MHHIKSHQAPIGFWEANESFRILVLHTKDFRHVHPLQNIHKSWMWVGHFTPCLQPNKIQKSQDPTWTCVAVGSRGIGLGHEFEKRSNVNERKSQARLKQTWFLRCDPTQPGTELAAADMPIMPNMLDSNDLGPQLAEIVTKVAVPSHQEFSILPTHQSKLKKQAGIGIILLFKRKTTLQIPNQFPNQMALVISPCAFRLGRPAQNETSHTQILPKRLL